MTRAECVGVILVVIGVVALVVAAGLTWDAAAALAVLGVASVVGGIVTVRAAAMNDPQARDKP